MESADQRRAIRALTFLNPRLAYHRASIRGLANIPTSGGAVIVSNHGRLDFDSFLLVRLILLGRGRLARLLADHMWFRLPLVDRIFASAGAIDGTRTNAARALSDGELVLAYPGGVTEVLGGRFGRESIDWSGRRGFARVAIDAGVPVIPVVGVGVNNGFVFVSNGRFLGRLLFRWILRLGSDYADYRNPLTVGLPLIPLPLSLAVNMPWPCRVTYFVGQPLHPPSVQGPPDESAARFGDEVEAAMWDLIDRYGRPPRT